MKKLLTIILSASLMVLVVACNNTTTENDSTTDSTNTENVDAEQTKEIATEESFEEFYANFVSDQEFQLSRVQFPLAGGINDFDGTEEWSIDEWYYVQDIATAKDEDEFLETEITETETTVKHRIYLPNAGFSVDYTYELIDGLWFLVERNSNNF